jgi:hypothetical protein
MKTKTFLLFCMLLSIAATKLSAQETRTYPYRDYKEVPENYSLIIYCDGVEIDQLSREAYILRQPTHYKDGEFTWWKGMVNNVKFTSIKTGEVFIGQIHDGWIEDLYHVRFNLIGNMGSHYIINEKWETPGGNWQLIESNTDCH